MLEQSTLTNRRAFGKLLIGSGMAVAAAAASQSQSLAQTSPSGSRLKTIKDRGVLRVAAPVGEPPYFMKDLKSGEIVGACVEMAKDIASILKVEVEFVDSTWGQQIIQLQTDKVDLGMVSTVDPGRALSVSFSVPYLQQPLGIVARPNFSGATWADINKPEVRVGFDIGSSHEAAVRQNAPNATSTGFTTRDEVLLALQAGRLDCAAFLTIPALTAIKKVPNLGRFVVINDPLVTLPAGLVIPKEENREWRDFLDVWVYSNTASKKIGAWMRAAFAHSGIAEADIPSEVHF
ncbi:hypothetical protein AC244_27375 [Ensifer adhaerens]|uniref:Solute-binding protein family 3/N-terminal domain-containing protein n=1 Tax=Ensifer adhaerens TaxID=106592 RepID=A0A0L8BI69_ENSAD|nr:transporter substrate-binding domain-containing protein [Ensifer adhaerens]KOF14362.1 hypothetical protein AC244_27375 [Ensifer adhaerens]